MTNAVGTVVVLGWLLMTPAAAHGREVTVPLQLDHEFLRQELVRQMYRDPGQTARVWDDGGGCNYLVLSDPRVDGEDGRLRVASAAEARVGTAIGDSCFTLFDWTGRIEVLEAPRVDAAAVTVRFEVVDSRLYGADGLRSASGTVWDWVKKYVQPSFEAVTIDLHAPVAELRAILPLFLDRRDTERTQRLLDSLALASANATATGVTATLRFDVAERPPPSAVAPPTAEPTLSPEELRQWEQTWQQWDAFVTFVAKHAATDTETQAVRQALLDVLLAARYDLLEALAPSGSAGPDRVRALFLQTWDRLAPVLRRVRTGLPGETAVYYMTFIAAGDALRAIDELGADSGLDISADGLRRLARMLAPSSTEDPLAYDVEVDPTLRELFGFGPPLPPPEENPDVDLSAWFVGRAVAATDPDLHFVPRLNRWVPTRAEIPEYLPLVRDLLERVTDRTLGAQQLAEQFHQLYRWMVPATAWQESCWRQFIKQGDSIKPLTSVAGSVGVMQVNQHVWRGFYDINGLRRDISYNARAGSEILLHYLRDLAIAKGEHTKTGSIDNLARATYAVYNAGPAHLRRYRRSTTPKRLQRIDEAFWRKYNKVKTGDQMAVAECFGY